MVSKAEAGEKECSQPTVERQIIAEVVQMFKGDRAKYSQRDSRSSKEGDNADRIMDQ